MHDVKISFLEGKYILLKPGDALIPFGIDKSNPAKPELRPPVVLSHNNPDKLITSILEVLCSCDYFFVNDEKKAYNTKFVTRVKGF